MEIILPFFKGELHSCKKFEQGTNQMGISYSIIYVFLGI